MDASVIVPTYNGARKIPSLLEALLRQSNPDFELIIIVDGSADNTEDILEKYRTEFKHFRVHVQKNSGRSIARNKGAEYATGSTLIFYDDDMIPNPNSIRQHLNQQAAQHFSCLIAGEQNENRQRTITDIQNYKATLSEKWFSKYSSGISELTHDTLFFSSGNCSVSKIVFEKLRGFNESLTDVEDYDLAYRALKKDIPVFFDKDNKAEHNDFITCKSYIRRLRQYEQARKTWRKQNQIHIQTGFKIDLLSLKAFYIFFYSAWWVRQIDRDFFVWLPKKLRFKLYDMVIQAWAVEFPNWSIPE